MAGVEQLVAKKILAEGSQPPAEMPALFESIVVNMDQILYEGKAKSIIVPAPYGNLALLPGHTPLFSKLTKGIIVVTPEQGLPSEFEIETGIVKVTQSKVVILVGF